MPASLPDGWLQLEAHIMTNALLVAIHTSQMVH